MNLFTILAFCLILFSCKKTDEHDILYHQLLNYRDELKMSDRAQELYLYNASRDNEFFKKRFDSLNKINTQLEKSFESIKYGERSKILELRNDYNTKYKLNLAFEKSNYDENITDSIFFRVMETDILRLKKEFQSRHMVMHGCTL